MHTYVIVSLKICEEITILMISLTKLKFGSLLQPSVEKLQEQHLEGKKKKQTLVSISESNSILLNAKGTQDINWKV